MATGNMGNQSKETVTQVRSKDQGGSSSKQNEDAAVTLVVGKAG